MWRFVLVPGSVLVLVTAAAWGSPSAGAHVGYTFGGDVNDESAVCGAQATFALMEAVSLEVAVSRFSDESTETETWVEEGRASRVAWISDYDITAITFTARFSRPLQDSLDGYLGAGVGLYLLDADGSARALAGSATTWAGMDIDPDSGYGLQAVAGVEYGLTDALDLLAEVRYAVMAYYYDATYSGTTQGFTWRESDDDSEKYVHGMLRFGLNYNF